MTRDVVTGGVAKWRLSSRARSVLTGLASCPDNSGLSAAIERAMQLAPGESLGEVDRRLLQAGAGLDEVAELLRCVSDLEAIGRADLLVEIDGHGGDLDEGAGVPCSRCGLASYAAGAPGVGDACPCCGHRPERIPAVVAERDAARSRVRWLVDPVLYLVSLSSERAEILGRAGSAEERLGDGVRLDVLDHQLDVALRGERAAYFRDVLDALEAVVDQAKSWLGARS